MSVPCPLFSDAHVHDALVPHAPVGPRRPGLQAHVLHADLLHADLLQEGAGRALPGLPGAQRGRAVAAVVRGARAPLRGVDPRVSAPTAVLPVVSAPRSDIITLKG